MTAPISSDILDVRGLTAAGAGTRELEERLGELGSLHVGCLVEDTVLVTDLGVEPVEGSLDALVVLVGSHGEGFLLGEADIHAVAATGTVGDRYGKGDLVVLEVKYKKGCCRS